MALESQRRYNPELAPENTSQQVREEVDQVETPNNTMKVGPWDTDVEGCSNYKQLGKQRGHESRPGTAVAQKVRTGVKGTQQTGLLDDTLF